MAGCLAGNGVVELSVFIVRAGVWTSVGGLHCQCGCRLHPVCGFVGLFWSVGCTPVLLFRVEGRWLGGLGGLCGSWLVVSGRCGALHVDCFACVILVCLGYFVPGTPFYCQRLTLQHPAWQADSSGKKRWGGNPLCKLRLGSGRRLGGKCTCGCLQLWRWGCMHGVFLPVCTRGAEAHSLATLQAGAA
jgi:hypothetical protein